MNPINSLRKIKNRIVGKKEGISIFIKLVNTPIIGDIYDFFYFKFIKKKIKNSEMLLTIEPNNICNLACVMCPYKRMKRKKETMSLELFKRIVDEGKKLGCKEVHLTQYNEPFTDKHLFERLAYIRKKSMKSSFYSNAMLLDKKMREKLLKNPVDLIRFSVDGVKKETLESIRKGANYEKIVNNITSLYKEKNEKKQKFPVIEVFFTILDRNRKEAEEFLKFWEGKCDFVSLYPADSRESGKFVEVNYANLKPYPCFNPKKVLVLSNGKVALCCVDVDGEVELGDLKKQTLKEILNSKRFKEIYKSQMERKCNIKMCKNCSKFYIDSAFSWWIY